LARLCGAWHSPEGKQRILGGENLIATWRAIVQSTLRSPRVVRPAESNIDLQPQRAQPPALDSLEVSLLATFLRRYVTYCARRRRFAAMNGRPNYVSDVVADR
jgi:hypothetical protein